MLGPTVHMWTLVLGLQEARPGHSGWRGWPGLDGRGQQEGHDGGGQGGTKNEETEARKNQGLPSYPWGVR